MKKKSLPIIASTIIIIVIVCGYFINTSDYFSKGKLPKKISSEEIYPKGSIEKVRIFDENNNEKPTNLNQDDVNSMIKIIKNSNKELVHNYAAHLVQLNVKFTDSGIQLVRQDNETIYYVFHGGKINAICYKIKSKELSEIILKAAS